MAKRKVDFTKPIIAGAVEVARAVSAEALFVYADAVDDLAGLKAAIQPPTKLILVCRGEQDKRRAKEVKARRQDQARASRKTKCAFVPPLSEVIGADMNGCPPMRNVHRKAWIPKSKNRCIDVAKLMPPAFSSP